MPTSSIAFWLSLVFAITTLTSLLVLLYYWKKTKLKTWELETAHAQYQLLYQRLLMAKESVDMGVWDWNVGSGTVEWDSQLYKMYELPHNSVVSIEAWAKLIHPDDLETFNSRLELVAKSGGLQRFEARILRKNNAIRHLLFTMNNVPPSLGDQEGHIVGVNIDITHQKNLELDLLEAKESAESANQTKSSFLASMSHELRTPMNGIIGMLRLLSKTRLSEDQKRKMEIAHSSAQTLLSILNDILDFSKIEANELTLEEYDFDLRGLLEGVVQSLAFRANEKGLELLLDLCEVHHSKVKGDPIRLQQVLINLLSNAIKFTDEGEVIVSATLTELNTNLLRLVVSVEDTGIGIPSEKQTLLFNAFSRVESPSVRQNTGTGLGLAICKKLVQMMGGQIGFTSQYGEGSCFSFDILLQPANYNSEVQPEVSDSPVYILVVDDNKSHLEVISKQLEIWGAKVTLADSCWQALSLCETSSNLFHVALISKDMPGYERRTTRRKNTFRSPLRLDETHSGVVYYG